MKTRIIIEAEMSDEQCEALLSVIERTNETIDIKTETKVSYLGTTPVDEIYQPIIDELSRLEMLCNENYAMTPKEREWTSLHLRTAIERVGIKFLNSPLYSEIKTCGDKSDKTQFNDYEVWHFVGDRLPKNESFMCIVKMYNEFSDTWTTGIGVFNSQSNEWEATDSCGENWSVRYWRRCPEFIHEGHYAAMKESFKSETKSSETTNIEDNPIKSWINSELESYRLVGSEGNEDIVGNSVEFQCGNIVKSKIGGSSMGVTKVFNKELECIYYVDGRWIREKFPIDMMIKVDII